MTYAKRPRTGPAPPATRQRSSSPSTSATSPDLAHHRLQCRVCRHPECRQIEEEFLRWRSPEKLVADYGIADHSSLYPHAYASGLYVRQFCGGLIDSWAIRNGRKSSPLNHLIFSNRQFGRWLGIRFSGAKSMVREERKRAGETPALPLPRGRQRWPFELLHSSRITPGQARFSAILIGTQTQTGSLLTHSKQTTVVLSNRYKIGGSEAGNLFARSSPFGTPVHAAPRPTMGARC